MEQRNSKQVFAPALVQVRGVTKTYPGVTALGGVDLTVRAGEVHALTGENGSGKSTLSKVISGVVQPTSGHLEIDGVHTVLANPAEAIRHGIVSISQELSLAPTLSVAENIFLGRLPRRRGRIDWSSLNDDAHRILVDLDVAIDPRAKVGALSVELQQEIEIARALSIQARLIVLDEATSSLSEHATARLLEIVDEQRRKGVAVLMISHRMPELYQSCSVATVLRDGMVMANVGLPETTENELVKLMVGRELSDYFGSRTPDRGDTVLRVTDLATPDGLLAPTSFEVRAGEIVGVAGLVGSGKSELGMALAGAIAVEGDVEVNGVPVSVDSPASARKGGIGFVPEDRKRQAILPTRPVSENLSLAWAATIARLGFLRRASEKNRVRESIEDYGVVTASPMTLITALSGGNQQKAVLGRTFARQCDVLVLSEPTRGVDVGSKSQIYALLQEQVSRGSTAVVLISSELPELLGLADRILVFYQGEVRAEFDVEGLDEETVAAVAVSGLRPESTSRPSLSNHYTTASGVSA